MGTKVGANAPRFLVPAAQYVRMSDEAQQAIRRLMTPSSKACVPSSNSLRFSISSPISRSTKSSASWQGSPASGFLHNSPATFVSALAVHLSSQEEPRAWGACTSPLSALWPRVQFLAEVGLHHSDIDLIHLPKISFRAFRWHTRRKTAARDRPR